MMALELSVMWNVENRPRQLAISLNVKHTLHFSSEYFSHVLIIDVREGASAPFSFSFSCSSPSFASSSGTFNLLPGRIIVSTETCFLRSFFCVGNLYPSLAGLRPLVRIWVAAGSVNIWFLVSPFCLALWRPNCYDSRLGSKPCREKTAFDVTVVSPLRQDVRAYAFHERFFRNLARPSFESMTESFPLMLV